MKKQKTLRYVIGKKYDGMMGRCYRPADKAYLNYGGRGIRVCGEWIKDINTFKTWVLSELDRLDIDVATFVSQSKELQLDRIDPNGHYTPANCRLVSAQMNTRNRRGFAKVVESAEGEVISW